MDKITIVQPQGLGDILFTQKIAHKLIENGYKVYWPLVKYRWLSDYIFTENLNWFNCPEPSHTLKLNNSIEFNHPYDIMTCKYSMIGNSMDFLPKELHKIEYKDWCNYFNFERNHNKENYLFYDKNLELDLTPLQFLQLDFSVFLVSQFVLIYVIEIILNDSYTFAKITNRMFYFS